MPSRIEAMPVSYHSMLIRVSRTIRGIRKERGLSLRAMAREVGCSRSVLNQIENMEGLPHMATTAALCNTYGLSWSDLLGEPADHKL